MDIKKRFTIWYIRRGYIFDPETGFECPFWVKPLLIFFSPSVYTHITLGERIYKNLMEGMKGVKMKEQEPIIYETLDECRSHYNPPVKQYITCQHFGHSDPMNGGCWWCMEMTPLQWHMCGDETWIRGLLSPCACQRKNSREEAIEFIENYKQRHPMGNERRALQSEND